MSKRALRRYLGELDKEALEAQIIDLYDRFPEVKTYYDFVFNPKEDRLMEEARTKIREEYFPVRRKKAKARRSIAKKYIRHFQTLGVSPTLIADLMRFNLMVALKYSRERRCPEAFFKSMFQSFKEWVSFTVHHGLYREHKGHIREIVDAVQADAWPNGYAFGDLMEQFDT